MKEADQKKGYFGHSGNSCSLGSFLIFCGSHKRLTRSKGEIYYKKNLSCQIYHTLIHQGRILLLLFVMNFIFWGINYQNLPAQESSPDITCCGCHTGICNVDLVKTYVHPPFLEQQCSYCHVYNESAAANKQISSATESTTWLDDRFSPALEHWFVIRDDMINSDKLVVSARDLIGQTHKQVLALPAPETLPVTVNDNRPPVIESAHVIGVYEGILNSARIGWITDEEADSEIRYGIETLQYSVKEDQFTTDHEIVLQNLQADQTYQFIIVSRDIFGNETVMDTAFFSTENLSPYSPPELGLQTNSNFVLETQFSRYDDSYIIKFTSTMPVTLSVGTMTVRVVQKAIQLAEPVIVDVPDHPPMRNKDELLVSVCTNCHTSFSHTGNHPVNVQPSTNVIIPADYTTSLDGKITCVTCHMGHASDFAYMLRFQYKDENMTAGGFPDVETALAEGGCFNCHANKGVLPKNRIKLDS